MSNDPILSRLGFARKAGRLSVGFAKSKEALEKGISSLIIVAYDVSEKSEKEIRFFSKGKVTVGRVNYTIDEISRIVGLRGGIVSVNDEGFANAILKFDPFNYTL